jgi:hypothetical protein
VTKFHRCDDWYNDYACWYANDPFGEGAPWGLNMASAGWFPLTGNGVPGTAGGGYDGPPRNPPQTPNRPTQPCDILRNPNCNRTTPAVPPAPEADRTPDQCYAENTAWTRSDLAVGTAVMSELGSLALAGGGILARAQGNIAVRQAFADGNASAFTWNNGVATAEGASDVAVGEGLLEVGGGVAVGLVVGAGAYFAASWGICQLAPDYGS